MSVKSWHFLLLTVALLSYCYSETIPCALRKTVYGFVCVCNTTHCDYLENPSPLWPRDYTIISSTKAGLRFASSGGEFGAKEKHIINDYRERARISPTEFFSPYDDVKFEPISLLIDQNGPAFVEIAVSASSARSFFDLTSVKEPPTRSVHVTIDRYITHQTIIGFGGAFTGAVSHVLQQVEQPLQDHVYRSYFGEGGIGFTMLRMTIGGCDFDLKPWAYNEEPRNDIKLSNFTELDARDELKLKQIKRLKTVAELDDMKIMAAAWSPPIWMKSNNQWTGFSQLKPDFYQTWADYHLRFLELMDAKNTPIWAISTGNEPLNGVIGWFFVHFMSLGWTPLHQATWLSEHLGPTIKNSKYKNVLIFGNDDQRYTFPSWFKVMNLSRPDSLDYLDGLAVHWYWDDIFGPSLIDAAHKEMPDKLLLNTESCIGDKPWQKHGPELGSWERGEKYMSAFMQDLQHSFNGWIDWNLVLDEQGGPSYANNFVDAPVIMNVTNRQEFYKQPIFYAIGHFSKFIPEGSVRIDVQISNIFVDVVAFRRPDERIAVIIFNSGYTPLDVTLNDSVRGNIVINIPARSMHTIVYN